MSWSVSMFASSGMYGFASSPEEGEVFFHATDFARISPGGPPPVLGEAVAVSELVVTSGNRRQARLVRRLSEPRLIEGVVRSFDAKKGWGFIDYADRQAFLHASEIVRGWLPVIGTRVEFYEGSREGRPRACWVRPRGFAGVLSF